jgi:adenylylsulfate kinase
MQSNGFTIWLTGLSGAGKTTISEKLQQQLRERQVRCEVLDGDIVRENLSKGLSFSREDRNINILRIGFVAELLSRNGVGVIVSAISPYNNTRNQVREKIKNFIEVYVKCPIACIKKHAAEHLLLLRVLMIPMRSRLTRKLPALPIRKQ